MVELQDIFARFGQFELSRISFAVPTGDYCVLLGPPGSGKTSIIELICGLRPIRSGRILLDGAPVTHLDPAERQIAYVPQDYALFPSMSVFENIAFGLKMRRCPRADIRQRVADEADRLGITSLLDRSCKGLSGGERQRVALARALVLRTGLLLLDEPVSALDESTRERVCLELRHLHEQYAMTTLHVSHNFEETRLVADHVAVMNEGRLMQFGSADEVFNRPANAFVARFVRAGNILPAHARRGPDGSAQLTLAGQRFDAPQTIAPGETLLLLRPQDVRLAPDDGSTNRPALRGRVAGLYPGGPFQWSVKVILPDGSPLTAALPRADGQPGPVKTGQAVRIEFDPARLHVLDR